MQSKIFYSSNFFNLFINKQKDSLTDSDTEIILQVHSRCVNTRDIPDTLSFVSKYCPRVLKTECFNEKNLPFKDEVKATEIGHLFEHILLEQLCQLKSDLGFKNVAFNGRTDWDWGSDSRGVFHIFIDIVKQDYIFFGKALDKTIRLTELLLSDTSLRLTKYSYKSI